MEIALLADMVKELILDNEEVALPGLGTFVTEVVPASFSDRGYTINPPYRRLSFRERQGSDDMICLPSCIQRLMGLTWKRPGR